MAVLSRQLRGLMGGERGRKPHRVTKDTLSGEFILQGKIK